MPSGTCSRRTGFAGAIRLLASLIVLVSCRQGNSWERIRQTHKRSANASAGRSDPRLGLDRAWFAHGGSGSNGAARGVMAWQGSVPAFPDGMTGQPIWSLHWRVRSEHRTIGGSTSGKIRNGVEPCDGAPGEIRTHDLCLRRAALYPAELRAR